MRGVIYTLPFLLSFLFGGRGTVKPQISLPPCTETLCIKLCGLHHVNSMAISGSCYRFHNMSCPMLNITGSLTLDTFVKDIIGRVSNITLTMGPGVSISLPDTYGSYCSHEARHARTTCPIPANTQIYFKKLFNMDVVQPFMGKQGSARGTLEDEDGHPLVCLTARGRFKYMF